MPSLRQTKVAEAIAHLAGDFIARNANRDSLITVTRADISPDLSQVTIFFSVLPEKMERVALAFLKRERSEFREFIKKHHRMKSLPTVDFEIDYGEKNRQLIDALTRKKECIFFTSRLGADEDSPKSSKIAAAIFPLSELCT